ncbi:hypothetical protein C4F40_01085 [Sphingobacterium sp. Ka21]|uniref:Polysaccharide biosynthesis protein n=2 Tax=Sphingobacterium pedocola TaxID=2082722 RepID=A0ABR9T1X9_9SPHI|nr:hypothetical protein [Sphingobacterium pedocola]
MFGMGLSFLNQIAMVPFLILIWGVEKYADWILITALSSFFTMSNMGLNQATNNEFVLKYQQKDVAACSKLLSNSLFFILLMCSICLSLSSIISFFFGFKNILNTTVFDGTETNVLFILLLLNIFLKMYGGVYNGIYRVQSYSHLSAMIDNVVQLSGIFILFFGIWLQINVILIMIAYNIPAFLAILYRHYHSQKWFKFSFSFQELDWSVFKSLIRPSIAFMLVPLGLAVSNQGLVFVVNALFGSTILVAFTTTRTLVNFLRSLINVFGNSVYPEISNSYSRKDTNTMNKVYYRSLIITFLVSIIAVIVLMFAGKPIYLEWTKHALVFHEVFFKGMLLVLFISCSWNLSSTVLLATNNHFSFTVVFLVTQILGVGFVYIFLLIYPYIEVIPLVLFLTEFSLLIFTIFKVNQLVGSNFKTFAKQVLLETKYILKISTKKIYEKNSSSDIR